MGYQEAGLFSPNSFAALVSRDLNIISQIRENPDLSLLYLDNRLSSVI